MAGLYELPHLPGTLTAEEIIRAAEDWGLHPQYLEKTVGRTHIFTHIQWNMTGDVYKRQGLERSQFLSCGGQQRQAGL